MKTLGEKLGRIIIPMLTPFKDNGDIHYAEAERLADFLITRKYCDSIVVAGTTGEFNTLEHEERIELFRVVKKAAAGRIPLVAGNGQAPGADQKHPWHQGRSRRQSRPDDRLSPRGAG